MVRNKKEKILKTAEKIVSKVGIEKARLSDVAKELGVTHAALYKYFNNQDDLFE